jgi:RNA polymerase sigma-70 factor (ECF subfamily)
VDEILVLDCQNGSFDALDLLVTRWQKRLWRHAFYLTGNADAAWDVTQDSWLAIVLGVSRLDDSAKLKPWAFRIVTNKANDWIRLRGRNPQVDDRVRESGRVSEDMARYEVATDLQTILCRLPPQLSTILSLYYLENLPISDLARILSIPPGTVKSRLHTGRTEFRRIWDMLCESKNAANSPRTS